MKLIVIFLGLVSLCSGGAIPLIPGDNSHYVEGVSQYIWMADSEGNPVLVDLQATENEAPGSRDGADNEYWLFTRQNPTSHQLLVNGDADSILNSNYNADLPTSVVVHGWNNDGTSELNPLITSALLYDGDVNVIVVDWRKAASRFYTSSSQAVPDVGLHLANFINFLFNTSGGSWDNVHLIGHSLGAHIVGNAGRHADGKPARVTGMDPAGPLWGGNSNALDVNSGVYVECIHTDGGFLGIMDPICHANFYPNGGRNFQPGCWHSVCSHGRSTQLFASSVRTSHLVGRRCTDLDEAKDEQCAGDTLVLGNSNLEKRGEGLYGLTTESSWPF